MNIRKELEADRLAIDYDTPHVLIRYDLYGDMLDVSMYRYAEAVAKKKWYERLLIRQFFAFEAIRGRSKEEVISHAKVLLYLQNIREFINEHRKILYEKPMQETEPLNFSVVNHSAQPLFVGYQIGDDWHIKPYKQPNNSQTQNTN